MVIIQHAGSPGGTASKSRRYGDESAPRRLITGVKTSRHLRIYIFKRKINNPGVPRQHRTGARKRKAIRVKTRTVFPRRAEMPGVNYSVCNGRDMRTYTSRGCFHRLHTCDRMFV